MGALTSRDERALNRFGFVGFLISFLICSTGRAADALPDSIGAVVPAPPFPPVNGVGLLLAGLVLLALEAHLFTFGALGALGVAALSAGLLLWYRVGGVSIEFVIATIAFFSLVAAGLVVLGFRTRRMKFGHGVESLVGRTGIVKELSGSGGMVSVRGEFWAFENRGLTPEPIAIGDEVEVINQINLVLGVKKIILQK